MSLLPREAFPVLKASAYLNAGTCGPLPTVAVEEIERELRVGLRAGRTIEWYARLGELAVASRQAWARVLGGEPADIALTLGATDGVARALAMVDWRAGDELLIGNEEHPGVTGPAGALARRRGVTVREAPPAELAGAAGSATKLIVVSHVGWLRGDVADLAAIGAAGVPVVVDGAQSAGAIPVDVAALARGGVVAYAAAGQKWTCGPVGTGALWVSPSWQPDGGAGVWPGYGNLADPAAGLDAQPWPGAARLDAPSLSAELLAGGLAALELLEAADWPSVHAAAIERAAELASTLTAAGVAVGERGDSTLVAWHDPDPAATLARAAAAGVVIRGFEGHDWLRASCGAWTSEEDVARLLEVVAG